MRIRERVLLTAILACGLLWSASRPVLAQYECGRTTAPVPLAGVLAAGDPDQTTAVFRPGPGTASTCLYNTIPPGSASPGTYNYDAHVITNPNPGPGCVTVFVETSCSAATGIFVAAYSSYNPTAPSTGMIGHLGGSPFGVPATFSFPLAGGASATLVVSETNPGSGCSSYLLVPQLKTRCHQRHFERDGNLLADYAVFRPGSPARWFYKSSPTDPVQTRNFGTTGDIPVHGDLVRVGGVDDGRSELSVFRPGNSTWYIAFNDSASSYFELRWGAPGDIPVSGDFDGDGTDDITVFRPSNGNWYFLHSSSSTFSVFHWGANPDTPVVGDFDGDARADFAVVRPDATNHRWFVLLSNFNYSTVLTTTGSGTIGNLGAGVGWGLTTDKLCPGDYNGDGRTDVAVWRPIEGKFYIRQFIPGASLVLREIRWGAAGDIPQPADFDGDNKHDAAIYRPSTNTFWVLRSSDGALAATALGTTGDQPISAAYRIQ